MPNWEPAVGGVTILPNPFWGGFLFPLFVFALLYAWPWLERKFTHDQRRHDLLDRPRDNPTRTALGAALLSWVGIIFAVGASDRVFFRLGINYVGQIQFWRAGVWVVPIIAFFATRSVCRALARTSAHPLRAWQGEVVSRREDGGFTTVGLSEDREEVEPTQRPVGTIPGEETK